MNLFSPFEWDKSCLKVSKTSQLLVAVMKMKKSRVLEKLLKESRIVTSFYYHFELKLVNWVDISLDISLVLFLEQKMSPL